MGRLSEQQAKQILFNAQTAAYPNRDVPALLAPLYEYIEQTEAQLNEEYIDENGTGWNRPTAEAYYRVCKAREKWQAKAEQAQADNAAMVGVLKSIHRYIHPHNSLNYSGFIDDLIDSIKDTPHPGDPIRQEFEQLRAVRDAVEDVAKLRNELEQYKLAFDLCLERWQRDNSLLNPMYKEEQIASMKKYLLDQAKAGGE